MLIHATGETLDALFHEAFIQLTQKFVSQRSSEIKVKKIKISGKDRKDLMHKFLDEVLFLHDVGGFLSTSIEKIHIAGLPVTRGNKKFYHLVLTAQIRGMEIKPQSSGIHIQSIIIREHINTEKKFSAEVVLS